jgi:hypothetical protein
MQDGVTGITSADPLQKRQERNPILLLDEPADQRVALEVIEPEEMPDTAGSLVRRPQASALSRPAMLGCRPLDVFCLFRLDADSVLRYLRAIAVLL